MAHTEPTMSTIGVEGADFVEVHALDRHLVDVGLHAAEALEQQPGPARHALGQAGLGDHLQDLVQAAVPWRVRRRRARAGLRGPRTGWRRCPSGTPWWRSARSRRAASVASAARSPSSGTPRSISAPSTMSPDAPEKQSK
ncbi:MAG: hypothetical protein MZV64_73585 [Ignavibacteriales bacterium]|nr:hypothetical protein [Ignavibacteriales bacterium]